MPLKPVTLLQEYGSPSTLSQCFYSDRNAFNSRSLSPFVCIACLILKNSSYALETCDSSPRIWISINPVSMLLFRSQCLQFSLLVSLCLHRLSDPEKLLVCP